MRSIILALLLVGASAFVTPRSRAMPRMTRRAATSSLSMEILSAKYSEANIDEFAEAEAYPTYWEDYPPSEVIGTFKGASSSGLGVASLLALGLGAFCLSQNNIASPVSLSDVNPFYIVGTGGLPIAWGLHVASWIQKKNGK